MLHISVDLLHVARRTTVSDPDITSKTVTPNYKRAVQADAKYSYILYETTSMTHIRIK